MNQDIARDGLVGSEQQNDEERPQLRAADLHGPPVSADFERPEDPVVDHVRSPIPADSEALPGADFTQLRQRRARPM